MDSYSVGSCTAVAINYTTLRVTGEIVSGRGIDWTLYVNGDEVTAEWDQLDNPNFSFELNRSNLNAFSLRAVGDDGEIAPSINVTPTCSAITLENMTLTQQADDRFWNLSGRIVFPFTALAAGNGRGVLVATDSNDAPNQNWNITYTLTQVQTTSPIWYFIGNNTIGTNGNQVQIGANPGGPVYLTITDWFGQQFTFTVPIPGSNNE